MIVVHSGETEIHYVSERSLAWLARAYLKLSLMYLKRLCLTIATWVILESIITLIFLEIKLYIGLHSECMWDIHVDNDNLHCWSFIR